ncbi:hypothetical protein L830_3981 [Mycobacteroides abscessus MAB_082312_2258]|nr:hypothetical protein L830_3981 [Mycobacteroides abscessus MAB_082312_2258]
MVLTGRAGLVAALSTLLILVSPWPVRLFWLLLLALALLIAVDIAAAASPRRLTLTRSGPDSIRLGESAEIVLLAQNPGRRLRGWIRDSWAPSMRAAPRAHRVDLRSGERTQIVTSLRPLRRGDHKPATVTVRTIGPLGIAGRQGRHDVPWQLRVLPPFLSRKHLPSRLAKLRELEGAIPVLIRGQGTEFDSLREYVVGDDVRSIDWRASARRNDVVVRTWRPERDRRILVVLDTGRTSAGRIGVDPTSGDPSGWPGWIGLWMPHCCWWHWRLVRATGWTSWPTTARCAPKYPGPRATSCFPWWSTRWLRWSPPSSSPMPAAWSPPSAADRATAR